MKALLIKSLSSTERLPARFKVTIEGQKPLTINQESQGFDFGSCECIQLQAARIALLHWGMERTVNECNLVVGQLPNGNHVVTIFDKPRVYRAEYQNMKGETITEFYLSDTRIKLNTHIEKVMIENRYFSPVTNIVKYYVGNDLFKEL